MDAAEKKTGSQTIEMNYRDISLKKGTDLFFKRLKAQGTGGKAKIFKTQETQNFLKKNNMISIRSYRRREGRMIPSRQRALDELWLDYGITEQGPLDLNAQFGRPAPCHLEIGFGMGEALLEMARKHPENNYLGVDVYLPGVGQLLLGIREMGITNVRIDRRDAMELLALLPAGSVRGVSLFFPDPWPKTTPP